MIYLRSAREDFQNKIFESKQTMSENPAEQWDVIIKVGVSIPLHKKGAKDNPDNFRDNCLLSMVCPILAKVLTSRLRDWSEQYGPWMTIRTGLEKVDQQLTQQRQ